MAIYPPYTSPPFIYETTTYTPKLDQNKFLGEKLTGVWVITSIGIPSWTPPILERVSSFNKYVPIIALFDNELEARRWADDHVDEFYGRLRVSFKEFGHLELP